MKSKLKQVIMLVMSLALFVGCQKTTAGTTATTDTTTSTTTDTTSTTSTSTSTITTTAAAIVLPRTGQTLCYDAAGATISCAGTGQDGDTLKGGAWASPRFTDKGDGTMQDNNTGLIWSKDANAPGPTACVPAATKNWQAALDYVKCLNTNSYLDITDWRLPNVVELKTLFNASQANTATWLIAQGFTSVQSDYYRSSTTHTDTTPNAWVVSMYGGDVGYGHLSDNSYVWPVRSGQSALGSFGFLPPRTGQVLCYDVVGATTNTCSGTGQDGDTLTGVLWPSPRYTDQTNGTMKDAVTSLVWSKDANTPGPTACTPTVLKNWQAALDYVKCLNANSYLGFTDWRLPNRNELSSLVNYSQSNLSTWFIAQGFASVQSGDYWSSSTFANDTSRAWGVEMYGGHVGSVGNYAKSGSVSVWPVRAGQ